MNTRSLVAATVLLLAVRSVFGFGNDGHLTVGAVADLVIAGTHAETQVQAILGPNRTLAAAAIWADCAKGACGPLTPEMSQFVQANPKHGQYHYVDVPFQWTTYETSPVGTRDDDIVKILQQCIGVLKGEVGNNPHNFTPTEALLLTAHLVGDLHQPLHVGAAFFDDMAHPVVPSQADLDGHAAHEDLGGNWLLYSDGNLHRYWDVDVVTVGMGRYGVSLPSEYAAALMRDHVAPSAPLGDIKTWPAQWANETLSYSRLAHAGMSARSMKSDKPDEYRWRVAFPAQYQLAAEQLAELAVANGGYRLAQVLAAIWP